METWLQCRLKHVLSQTLPRDEGKTGAQADGTLVHAALHNYMGQAVEPRDMVGALNQAVLRTQIEPSDEVRRALYTFTATILATPARRELELFAPLDEHYTLHGILDGLYLQGGEAEILEYKFSRLRSNTDPLVKVWFGGLQQHVYRRLVEHNYPGVKVTGTRFVLLNARETQVLWRPLTGDVAKWDALINEVVHEMYALPVVPHYGAHCKWCPFYNRCLEELMVGSDTAGYDEVEEDNA